MGKYLSMLQDGVCINDGAEMPFNNSSRVEQKRAHQWFIDAIESEHFPNKKQAMETSGNRMFPGVPNPHFPLWDSIQTVTGLGQFTAQLLETEPTRNMSFGTQNRTSVDMGNMTFGCDPTIALSMSHSMEDPGVCLSYGQKTNLNQVKDSGNFMSVKMGNLTSLNKGVPNSIFFDQVKDMSLPMSHVHKFDKGDKNTISFGQVKNSDNRISASLGHSNKGESNTISFGLGTNNNSGDPVSIGHSITKVDRNTICFSGFHEESVSNPSITLFNSHDPLMNQSSILPGDVIPEVFTSTAEAAYSKVETVQKNKSSELKTSKRDPPNNFPSNVRSLLSTGILDGVDIKYVSWSQEELGGVIKGSGYLCGCQECKLMKVLNAFEFERHAGCKTKHPNNHIFFGNGKTIYGIVQELRSTPQHLLFEAIQTVTGSEINKKAFLSWKESFQAATRELQRIYGKGELSKLSQLGNT